MRDSFFFLSFNVYLFGCWVLVVAHRSSLHHVASFFVLHGLPRCGPGAQYLQHTGLSCSAAHGIFVPQLGIQPAFPALHGRCLTTGSPGKFLISSPLFKSHYICIHVYMCIQCLSGRRFKCSSIILRQHTKTCVTL